MKNFGSGFSLILVLVTVALVAVLAFRIARNSSDYRRHTIEAIADDQPAPPSDVANNPNSGKKYAKDTACHANCEAPARTCRSLADSDEAKAACEREFQACDKACP
jgi:hypothetical protein